MEGKWVAVLVEGPSKRGHGQLTGRSPTNKIVNFHGDPDLIGRVVDVHIGQGYRNSLAGEV